MVAIDTTDDDLCNYDRLVLLETEGDGTKEPITSLGEGEWAEITVEIGN